MTASFLRRHIPRILHQHNNVPRHHAISTVQSGTLYEHQVIHELSTLGAHLERTGGASDQGIDMRGKWQLPDHPAFYMVGQCKHYGRKRIGPSVIREWEGVMSRQMPDTLGLVAASSGFTRGAVDAARSSVFPIALATIQAAFPLEEMTEQEEVKVKEAMLEECQGAAGNIRGLVWNAAAEPFIGRMMVVKKHFDVRVFELTDPAQFTIQILWDGKPLIE